MKITKLHGGFWLSKKAPSFLRERIKDADVNDLIPMDTYNLDLHNTINLLKMKRKRGADIYSELMNLAGSEHSTPTRKNYCIRWWRKIYENRKNRLTM